jgi:hypothetical protein
MPRLNAKLPRITPRSLKQIKLSDEQWRTTEATYRHEIPSELRQQIIIATNKFLLSAEAESNVGLSNDATKRVTSLRKQAQSIIKTIEKRPIGDATREYTDEEIAFSYSGIDATESKKLFPALNYVAWFHLELRRFVWSCDKASETLREMHQYAFWRDGAAWEQWIRELTRLLKSGSLPTGVRKDVERQESLLDRASDFVEFVRAFQAYIPDRHGRSSTRSALAEAISKARKPTRTGSSDR